MKKLLAAAVVLSVVAAADANQKGSAFEGTITVSGNAPPTALTLQALPPVLTYGAKTTLAGSLANARPNQSITILAQACGAPSMTPTATVTATTGGAFTATMQPPRNTTYAARFKNSTSASILVKVKPKLTLRRVARGRFTVRVLAADSFVGKAVVFQRYVRSTGRWVAVKTVVLKAGPQAALPLNPTQTSLATFPVRIKAGLRVRAIMTPAQVGGCYAATRSAVILS